MRAFQQIAIRTADIDGRIMEMGATFSLPEKHTRDSDDMRWVRDKVSALHVFMDKRFCSAEAGDTFQVQLAFNYNLIPGRELELIQLLTGETVQLLGVNPNSGLSHFGYHIADDASLVEEIRWWVKSGYTCAQVSVTTDHSGTNKRYMYAFIDTRTQCGAWTKIISRRNGANAIESLFETYRHVND